MGKMCESGCVHVGADDVVRDLNGNQIGMRSGDVIDFRTKGNPYGLAFAACSVPAVREPHPVFGDVPRGWVVLRMNDDTWDAKGVEYCVKPTGFTADGEKSRVYFGDYWYECEHTVADVSRLIAEAQRG